MVRCMNIGFAEGIMLAILFGNCFAPTIDYFVWKRTSRKGWRDMSDNQSRFNKDSISNTLIVAIRGLPDLCDRSFRHRCISEAAAGRQQAQGQKEEYS